MHHLIFSFLLAGTSGALAQEQPHEVARPIAPAEVVLYIQSDLKRTDFVQPLVCALRRVLTAPVSVQALDLPLGSELLATPTQFEATKVADRFIQRTADEGNAPSFKYLLVPFDLNVEAWNWRYAFSASFGDETTSYHVGVVSTARIVAGNWWLQSPWDHEITATRAYKLILNQSRTAQGIAARMPAFSQRHLVSRSWIENHPSFARMTVPRLLPLASSRRKKSRTTPAA
ncbi:hypothetical protein [Bradyrhizobium sp. CCGUVB14]|uniref:hypothetical protein n=1 Tax=Bradyrhizobium sp. CCGUVB14 TaxID=2949628 RepID=UPI0020B271B7|nr:hypothetical protein [Bradyrhizobium sp. CCGUVB14]MCP3446463.1 hypothetical protein [Bradyrhizobium sp. CCGUVB14]